ncbi:MAG TPA: tetratricopeptide repeat protein, partial [Nitrososphaera sp.]|nr:tetratricopeptide repeat protein [Nitrososphaera sp.]
AIISWLSVWIVGTIKSGPAARRMVLAREAANKSFAAGRFDEALHQYRELLSTNNRSGGITELSAHHGMAQCYQSMNRLPEAEECYKKAVATAKVFKSQKEFIACIKDYAALLRQQGRDEEADEQEALLKTDKNVS